VHYASAKGAVVTMTMGVARENQRGGASDAARCAGDDNGFSLKVVRRFRHAMFLRRRDRIGVMSTPSWIACARPAMAG
jgi:hypothetical protein